MNCIHPWERAVDLTVAELLENLSQADKPGAHFKRWIADAQNVASPARTPAQPFLLWIDSTLAAALKITSDDAMSVIGSRQREDLREGDRCKPRPSLGMYAGSHAMGWQCRECT